MRDRSVPRPTGQQAPERIGVPLHVRPGRPVAGLAGDPELAHGGVEARRATCLLRQPRPRLGVVAQHAVVVPAAEVTQVRLRIAPRALRLEERRVHRDPPRRRDVPGDRQAPHLARPAAAVELRQVLLIAVAAHRHDHVDVEQRIPGLAPLVVERRHAHVRATLGAAGHRRAKAEVVDVLAGERRQHGLALGALRHRPVVGRRPAGVLGRMTGAARRGADHRRLPARRRSPRVRPRARPSQPGRRRERPRQRRPEQQRRGQAPRPRRSRLGVAAVLYDMSR
ncbi:hypothetical protein OV079_12755 [Nannocystis pusilla]|uniref:Uncharacterized protein n=1 Tax=Nannocystis pusilla TaxID=889268 RepID=A0A9X3ENG5_9BACT|nr:hypothetical protein [Nannocystis pusilla]MCY1006414.1 hypothetical protein [Nannocystis pusilla]